MIGQSALDVTSEIICFCYALRWLVCVDNIIEEETNESLSTFKVVEAIEHAVIWSVWFTSVTSDRYYYQK